MSQDIVSVAQGEYRCVLTREQAIQLMNELKKAIDEDAHFIPLILSGSNWTITRSEP